MLPMTQAYAAGSTNAYAGGVGGVGNIAFVGAGDPTTLHVESSADRGNTVDKLNGGTGSSTDASTTGSTIDKVSGGNGSGSLSSGYRPAATPDDGTGGSTGGSTDNGGNASESDIINNQVNLDTVWNNTNIVTDNVNGDVNGAAAATANAFQAITFNNTVVNNNQYASGAAVGSDLNAMTTNVNGSVNLSNTVACNSADVSTDPAYTVVNSKQECAVGDPSQATNVFAAQVQNDVNVSGAVAANVYTEDTNAKYNYVNTNQINESAVNSTTNVQTYNVGGTVNVSSSAVGNTAQVVHY